MAIRIEEQFSLDAPADRVFEYLLTVEEVVECIPGATLLEKQDDETFVGEVKVSVGPVKAAYKGKASFTEVDRESRTVKMKGQGQEKAGGGSASMTMTSRVAELDGGGAEVRVEVDLDVVGKLVQFGRGMIQEVSRQLFNQFADCVRSTLSGDGGGSTDAGGDRPSQSAGGGSEPHPDRGESGPSAGTHDAGEPATGTGATATPPPHQGGGEPVKILPILWRALRDRIARMFGRR